ncbi:BTAD domain-containing putative transcriptional regulator [Kitasatospora sp. NPDC088391]|uniref:AfsR/SARP family transcriptional regulator n=1 Tax=Kitasatospora sp. NPDC088391 TaxID=3364074 RepID=UPI00380CA703
MRFGLLGSLTVHDGGRDLPVRGPLARTLLAVLLLNADRPVPLDALTDALWGAHAPATAEASLRNLVSRLRRTLDDERGDRLRATPAGYRLHLTDDELDTRLFDAAIHRARTARHQHDHATVRAETATALGLWRDDPLTGLAELAHRTPQCAQWREHRLQALEWRHDAELALGNPQVLIPDLTALTAEHPLRETFHLQLIRALDAAGHRARALIAYQRLRTTLREELGAEPGPAARELHRTLLAEPGPAAAPAPASTPAPAPAPAAPARPAPSQLPTPAAHFIGRDTQLAHLLDALTAPADRPAVAVVSGMAGVGKSALAVRTAHRLRDAFPDGQLFLNLHGATPGLTPLTPLAALTTLLRALGTAPGTVPDDPGAAAALLRGALAGTRTLLVLDDAAGLAQVRPLLPATPGCAVLVTSRSPLPALDAALHLRLDTLTERESIALVERAAGRATADRTVLSLEQNDLARLVHLCGRLPLALRIAAARLAARRHLPVRGLADRLTDPRDRLDELELDDLSIRRSLALSHESLRASPRATDRRAADALLAIGALDLPAYSAPQLAAVLDLTPARAATALERLTEAALLDEIRPDHYAPHDLVRDYARELPDPEQRHRLTRTALGWYRDLGIRISHALDPTQHTARLLLPPPADGEPLDRDGALALGNEECENLVVLVEQFAEEPWAAAELSTLVRGFFTYLRTRGRVAETVRLNEIVLRVARRAGDPTAEGYALGDLAGTKFATDRYEDALTLITDALAVWRQVGNPERERNALNNRGLLLSHLGRTEEAGAALEEALELGVRAGDHRGQAVVLSALGNLVEAESPHRAIAYHRRSIEAGRRCDHPDTQMAGLTNIGFAHLKLGDPVAALHHFDLATAVPNGNVAWIIELETWRGRIEALRRLRRLDEALDSSRRMLDRVAADQDGHGTGMIEHAHGLVLRDLGRHAEALAVWHTALTRLTGSDHPVVAELRALLAAESA